MGWVQVCCIVNNIGHMRILVLEMNYYLFSKNCLGFWRPSLEFVNSESNFKGIFQFVSSPSQLTPRAPGTFFQWILINYGLLAAENLSHLFFQINSTSDVLLLKFDSNGNSLVVIIRTSWNKFFNKIKNPHSHQFWPLYPWILSQIIASYFRHPYIACYQEKHANINWLLSTPIFCSGDSVPCNGLVRNCVIPMQGAWLTAGWSMDDSKLRSTRTL